ncbi:hypothetical protein, partial [Deinococcus deserti]|uniref:hypothetical protein n=1 Tax=Deinococcus deserti TaxID=310783 RepID=UPI0039EC13F6
RSSKLHCVSLELGGVDSAISHDGASYREGLSPSTPYRVILIRQVDVNHVTALRQSFPLYECGQFLPPEYLPGFLWHHLYDLKLFQREGQRVSLKQPLPPFGLQGQLTALHFRRSLLVELHFGAREKVRDVERFDQIVSRAQRQIAVFHFLIGRPGRASKASRG